MFSRFRFSSVLALFFMFAPGFAKGQSFGTKFACCAAENNSTLSGGGCTSYNRTLRDRALSQVDAGARCIALGSSLYWGTHECPASNCGGGSSSGAGYVWRMNFTGGWNECISLASNQRVANSYCGRPSRVVEKSAGGFCKVVVNGQYEKLLSPGEGDCAP